MVYTMITKSLILTIQLLLHRCSYTTHALTLHLSSVLCIVGNSDDHTLLLVVGLSANRNTLSMSVQLYRMVLMSHVGCKQYPLLHRIHQQWAEVLALLTKHWLFHLPCLNEKIVQRKFPVVAKYKWERNLLSHPQCLEWVLDLFKW